MHFGMVRDDLQNSLPSRVAHMPAGHMQQLKGRINIPRRFTRVQFSKYGDLECQILPQAWLSDDQVVQESSHNLPHIRAVAHCIK